jgi:hypothetical protein
MHRVDCLVCKKDIGGSCVWDLDLDPFFSPLL